MNIFTDKSEEFSELVDTVPFLLNFGDIISLKSGVAPLAAKNNIILLI